MPRLQSIYPPPTLWAISPPASCLNYLTNSTKLFCQAWGETLTNWAMITTFYDQETGALLQNNREQQQFSEYHSRPISIPIVGFWTE